MPCRPARPPQGRAGSQQASGESQRKRGFERRRRLAHDGQRPRFAQKGRQRGGPRPGKARRWRAASTGGRHAGAVSTRTRRAALARASAPAGAGGAGSSSCMKTHHGQPAQTGPAAGKERRPGPRLPRPPTPCLAPCTAAPARPPLRSAGPDAPPPRVRAAPPPAPRSAGRRQAGGTARQAGKMHEQSRKAPKTATRLGKRWRSVGACAPRIQRPQAACKPPECGVWNLFSVWP